MKHTVIGKVSPSIKDIRPIEIVAHVSMGETNVNKNQCHAQLI